MPVPEVTGKQTANLEALGSKKDTVTHTTDFSSQPRSNAANPEHSLHLQGNFGKQ